MAPKTIVITGASDGVGAAAAARLHRSGEHVVVIGRSPGVDWISGEYYGKHRIGRANKQAADPVLAEQLWERSLDMVAAPGL